MSEKSRLHMKRKPNSPRCIIVAHRGASAYALENSMTACILSIQMGVKRIEFDIRATRDKILVLHHNRGIRVGKERQWIDNLTYKEVKEHKPTLVRFEDVLKRFGNKIFYDIDLKQTGIEELVVKLIKRYGIKRQLTVTSGNPAILWRFKLLMPTCMTMFYLNVGDRDLSNNIVGRILYFTLPKIFKFMGPHLMSWKIKNRLVDTVSFDPPSLVTRKIIEDFHAQGILVFAAPVNSAAMMHKFVHWGIDGFKTDRPDVAVGVLRGTYTFTPGVLPVRVLRRIGGKMKRVVVRHVLAS